MNHILLAVGPLAKYKFAKSKFPEANLPNLTL